MAGYQQQPQQQQPLIVQHINNGNRKGVNHVLHLILTIITLGVWLPVWIILAIANS